MNTLGWRSNNKEEERGGGGGGDSWNVVMIYENKHFQQNIKIVTCIVVAESTSDLAPLL